MRSRIDAARGFTLVEALVAATTVLVALSALAQLLTAAALTARRARSATLAAILAQQKLETLLAHAAVANTLAPSPAGTLASNVDGYCDVVDAAGTTLDGGISSPSSAAYIRRWAIEPVPAGTGGTLVLRVLVVDARRLGVDARAVTVVAQVP